MGVPISNVTRRVVYAASGTGPYAFTFEILANTDIAVYKDDTLLTLTTDYTVTINSNGTGSITLTASPTGATQIAIVGNRTIQRTTDFVTGGDFFANTVNDEMDQQTIFAQQNAEGLQRALQAPQTDPTTINMTLPRASVRASKVLSFDASGNPSATEFIGSNRGNWASGTLYYVRDIVKDTSTSNIWQCVTQHTSSGSQPLSTNTDAAKWFLLVDAAASGASATAAAASASAAATSASNASTYATNAASSASSASTSASNASTSATNAANSATAAASSASTASTAATNAGNSATAAASSATSASNSASSASTSATNASNSASAASTSASNAATSATNAANSASSASSSASTATTQAGIATTQATNAASSATAAAASAAAAAASFDAFDDIYLGAKSADPSVDNDGNALTTGDQYFNTVANELRIWNGTTWQAASTVGGTVTSLSVTGATTLGQNPTLSAGTANGVLYLNGSKVATSGSALQFDGTNLGVGVTPGVPLDVGGAIRSKISGGSPIYYFNDATYQLDIKQSGNAIVFDLNGGSEGMRLTSTGLGIGTSSPADILHISKAGDLYLRVANTSTGINAYFGQDSNGTYIGNTGASVVRFIQGSSERARIDTSGNVGIGTSSPAQRLEIAAASPRVRITDTDGGYAQIEADNGNLFLVSDNGNTVANSNLTFGVDGTERARIDSSGNFGIAVTSPAAKLDVLGDIFARASTLRFKDSGNTTQYGAIYGDATSFHVNAGVNNLIFYSAGSERARIDSSGNLLVGKTATSLSNVGVVAQPSGFVSSSLAASTNGGGDTLNVYSTGAAAYRFYVGMGGTISATSTTISAISDQRLKENIQDLDVGLDKIMALKPRKFDWKAGKGKDIKGDRGFIAQEFEQVFPDLIDEWKDPAPEGEEPYKSVRQDLIPVLVKAVQEQQAIIESLKARLDAANL